MNKSTRNCGSVHTYTKEVPNEEVFYGKMWTGITPDADTFHTVKIRGKNIPKLTVTMSPYWD